MEASAHRSTFDDFLNTVALGDCCVVQQFPSNAIDLVITDASYLINYKSRDGIAGDTDDSWLLPPFSEAYRVLKAGGFCVSFYGWSKADRYLAAWREGWFPSRWAFSLHKSYASGPHFFSTGMSKLTFY